MLKEWLKRLRLKPDELGDTAMPFVTASMPLSQQSPSELHRNAIAALDRFVGSQEPLTRVRLKQFMQMDHECAAMREHLAEQYFLHRDASPEVRIVLWKDAFAFAWHLAHGYQSFVRAYLDQREDSDLAAVLPLVTARAVHYFGQEVKWRYFVQQRPQPNMWKRLHKLYRIADSLGFAKIRIRIGAGDETTSVLDEYLRVLVMDAMAAHLLRPAQTEALEEWLKGQISHVKWLDGKRGAKYSHWADLRSGNGLQSVAVPIEGEKIRFADLDGLVGRLQELRKTLSSKRPLDRFGRRAVCRVKDGVAMVDYVELALQRGSLIAAKRMQKPGGGSEVICGPDQIIARIGALGDDRAGMEVWDVENQTDGGCCVKIRAEACKEAAIGRFVGLRLGQEAVWRVGVVRWLTQLADDALSMGIEKLSEAPRIVMLQAKSPTQATDRPLLRAKGLFLPNIDEKGIANSVIAPEEIADHGGDFELFDRRTIYTVRFGERTDRSGGWVRARLEILARRAGP